MLCELVGTATYCSSKHLILFNIFTVNNLMLGVSFTLYILCCLNEECKLLCLSLNWQEIAEDFCSTLKHICIYANVPVNLGNKIIDKGKKRNCSFSPEFLFSFETTQVWGQEWISSLNISLWASRSCHASPMSANQPGKKDRKMWNPQVLLHVYKPAVSRCNCQITAGIFFYRVFRGASSQNRTKVDTRLKEMCGKHS